MLPNRLIAGGANIGIAMASLIAREKEMPSSTPQHQLLTCRYRHHIASGLEGRTMAWSSEAVHRFGPDSHGAATRSMPPATGFCKPIRWSWALYLNHIV